MKELDKIRAEALLERYLLGDVSPAEAEVVEKAMLKFPALKQELKEIEAAFEVYAQAKAIEPDTTTKPMLMAFVNYTERLNRGEQATFPPALSENSKIEDYKTWLNRADLQEADSYQAMYGYIIGHTKERTNLIVWLKYGAPEEIHIDEQERFLIVEGTCDIVLDNTEVYSLKPGDYFNIPLNVSHRVEVTSNKPCKIILERKKIAA